MLRGTELVSYTNTYLEAGERTVSGTAVAVDGANAFVFCQTTANPTVTVVPLADINAPEPRPAGRSAGPRLHSRRCVCGPDQVYLNAAKANLSLFRYSTSQRLYLPNTAAARIT